MRLPGGRWDRGRKQTVTTVMEQDSSCWPQRFVTKGHEEEEGGGGEGRRMEDAGMKRSRLQQQLMVMMMTETVRWSSLLTENRNDWLQTITFR